jgi:hypothetical protein
MGVNGVSIFLPLSLTVIDRGMTICAFSMSVGYRKQRRWRQVSWSNKLNRETRTASYGRIFYDTTRVRHYRAVTYLPVPYNEPVRKCPIKNLIFSKTKVLNRRKSKIYQKYDKRKKLNADISNADPADCRPMPTKI